MTAGTTRTEYQTRLMLGPVMVVVATGLLVGDQYLAPVYPCLLGCMVLLSLAACRELYHLLAELPRPPFWFCAVAVQVVLLAAWPAHLGLTGQPPQPERDILWAFAAVVLLAFFHEMATYREPGESVVRISLLVWMAVYLGLLPGFLAQLRWWPPLEDPVGPDRRGALALALTFFVPKFCDIGAYFAGRYFGRHRMAPVLSPKKTWEGFAGGLLLAAVTAMTLNRVIEPGSRSPLLGSDLSAAGFGVVVGAVGAMGDLAESLIKRDRGRKDASHVVPGFGGVLDVIDSILFAAPVAYWWLRACAS